MNALMLTVVAALIADALPPAAVRLTEPEIRVLGAEPSSTRVGEDAVGLDVRLEVTGVPGSTIMVRGMLRSDAGSPITGQDSYFRSAVYVLPVEVGAEGTGRAVYRFSGEAIRTAMVDGPWDIELTAIGKAGTGVPTAEWVTPSFFADEFGEQVGRLVHAQGVVVDTTVRVRMIVDVSKRFEAHATVFLGATGEVPWKGRTLTETRWLEPGMRELVLTWDAGEAIDAGIEPPYAVQPSVAHAATATQLQPRRATVPSTLVADWHPVERRRREAAAAEAAE
ncbi:MAG: hypothetical protein AAGB48_03030 [Planctomycetota bacterium]